MKGRYTVTILYNIILYNTDIVLQGIQMVLLNPCYQDMTFEFLPVMVTESLTEPLKLLPTLVFSRSI